MSHPDLLLNVFSLCWRRVGVENIFYVELGAFERAIVLLWLSRRQLFESFLHGQILGQSVDGQHLSFGSVRAISVGEIGAVGRKEQTSIFGLVVAISTRSVGIGRGVVFGDELTGRGQVLVLVDTCLTAAVAFVSLLVVVVAGVGG
jgi:hypothetical protein